MPLSFLYLRWVSDASGNAKVDITQAGVTFEEANGKCATVNTILYPTPTLKQSRRIACGELVLP